MSDKHTPKNAPHNVVDAIKATAKKSGRTHNGQPTYSGVLKVKASWGRYSRTIGPERLTREDAQDDANRAKHDYVQINQLP